MSYQLEQMIIHLEEENAILHAYNEKLEEQVEALRKLVGKQAEDEGLWFVAQTAPEAYLQQELRKLHAAIEQEEI